MWKFNNKKSAKASRRHHIHAAEKVAAAIVQRQMKIAAWLGRKTQYWNKTSKLVALFLFCLSFGGFSLWLLIKAFY